MTDRELHRIMTSALRRRILTVPATLAAAFASGPLAVVWIPVTVVLDLAMGRRRLPITRLACCLVCWAWLESAGVVMAGWLWVTGRGRSRRANLRLQRWWIERLVGAMRRTTGVRIEVPDTAAFVEGPLVMLCRHASVADSVLSAWVVSTLSAMAPRYVLKRELLWDPCLDIVGNRLPNHFLDRDAADSAVELDALRDLASSMRAADIAIIFPEGTRASQAKRERMLTKIGARDAERAERLASLRHLLPPRPAGARALLAGSPTADVVLAWHVGFEGLDTFAGILRTLAKEPPTVRFATRRVPRCDVPEGDNFTRWLDDQWLTMDAAVDSMLTQSPRGQETRCTM
jgi:1-acyl-sn-glycerol-3-phosphate acyltransferase